jgi:succinate dehydrogenase/fumarate reductase flavoprotein subunit
MADTMILDLLTENGQISGAFGLDIRSGDYIHFKTKAVVMATGGWHKAFWPNTGMRDLSGEGIAMAHRAGADIGNMEFITFCCNVLLEPPMWLGSIATYVISLLAGGTLTNKDGENFLNAYDPLMVKIGTGMEWNKSFVSYATMKEVNAGKGGPQGGIFYGRGDVPWDDFEKAATMLMPKWKYKAMDLRPLGEKLKAGDSVEVGAAVEYFDGGIKVNERFETNVAGLYAAGECTLGPFGANRVFSAITEMLVHGAEAGKNAGAWAVKESGPDPLETTLRSHEDQIERLRHRTSGLRIPEVRRNVQQAAHRALGPIRNPSDLNSFVTLLSNVKADELPNLSVSDASRTYNKEIIDAIELENMVTLLEAAAKSALFRTESRGVHYREDFPDCNNDNWLKETILKRTDDGFAIETERVEAIHKSLPSGILPYLDMMKTMMTSRSDIGGHH